MGKRKTKRVHRRTKIKNTRKKGGKFSIKSDADASYKDEIKQLRTQNTELKSENSYLRREINHLNDTLKRQIDLIGVRDSQYSDLLDKATMIRDELVQKHNGLLKKHNGLLKKYSQLTNPPP